MLMMFSKGLRQLPLDQVMPFNDDDLIVICEGDIGFRLTNVVSDDNAPFSIRYLVENKPIFKCSDFRERMLEFSKIMPARLERFFDTKKVDYLFFDLEEQQQIQQALESTSLSCAIEIYIVKDGEFKKVELEDLSASESRTVLKHLTRLRVRAVSECREYYMMRVDYKKKVDKSREKFKKRSEKMKTDSMITYFSRYSKLKSYSEKKQVDKYFKLLLKKYHPDKGGDESIFVIINNDSKDIKGLSWYKSLK